MNKHLPSKRTLKKFGRDFAAAFVVFAAAYVADNAGALELSPEAMAILTPIALLIYRTARQYLATEPEA
jgi:hypothetical protein